MEDPVETINGKFSFNRDKVIGEGGFGSVYEGEEILTGEKVAIKEINKDYVMSKINYNEDTLKEEIIVMLKCADHPNKNLVRLIDYRIGEKCIYLIMEYCQDGSLKSLMEHKKFSETEAKEIAAQIVNGLYALHRKIGVIHRDLKPENVLCHQGTYKLIDFGISVQKDNFTGNTGTMINQAPEQLTKGSPKGKPVDIWSFGVILFQLLFGEHPFYKAEKSIYQGINAVVSQPLEIPATPAISQECADLLKSCFEKNPKDRIKIKGVKKHAWFDGLKTESKDLEEKKVANYDDGMYLGDFVDGKRHGKIKI